MAAPPDRPRTSGETSLELARLTGAYCSGALSVAGLVEDILDRIACWNDPALWITLVAPDALRARAQALDRLASADAAACERLPLFGIPFAVKDNIDVAGLPTTAGCPAFAYTPAESAPIVALLVEAGAVLIGKTNLDQFATGLVGTRSPYGTPRNPFSPSCIPGGSSSGSAVAVAAGLVSVALGTDTAGSGRVPAAFNNIVGLKPTRGLLSMRGVVPACRSFDTVSVLALTVEDALAVMDVAARFDPADPSARQEDQDAAPPSPERHFRFGVPRRHQLEFFGDAQSKRLFAEAVIALEAIGGSAREIDFEPLREVGKSLYDGPWVAERLDATEALLQRDPEAILPVTRSILETGRRFGALDAFRAMYRLAAERRACEPLWDEISVLAVPTTGTAYTVDQVKAEPLRLNANLGYYTNFVNLLDLAALALPTGFRSDGVPFGISLIGPAFSDRRLAAVGARLQRRLALPLGATGLG